MPHVATVIDQLQGLSDVEGPFDTGQFLQWDGEKFVGAAGGSGANTALSNLAAVAINTSLISDANNTDDLGSAAIRWKDLFLAGSIKDGSSNKLLETGTNRIFLPQGAAANQPGVGFIGQTDSGYSWANGGFAVSAGGNYVAQFTASIVRLRNANPLTWSLDPVNNNSNTGIGRAADGVVEANDGNLGTVRDFKARKYLDSNGVQVVTTQGAAVADATNGTDVITQLNTLLARLRAHGLIAT